MQYLAPGVCAGGFFHAPLLPRQRLDKLLRSREPRREVRVALQSVGVDHHPTAHRATGHVELADVRFLKRLRRRVGAEPRNERASRCVWTYRPSINTSTCARMARPMGVVSISASL